MKEFSKETRRRMSESAKARCKREMPKAAFVWTPFCTREELAKDYQEDGLSQVEIATKWGVSQKVVWRAMLNYAIPRRKAAKRNQHGELNSNWKGDGIGYASAHQRVKYARGAAKQFPCSVCGATDTTKHYDWANLTGNYSDVNDYAPMCRTCHREFDRSKRG